ncbi:MAG: Mth938-like domain-containing protein [Kangiellaceae bacterium]|nr:Mth938-like domain-containing protein [Kangiellaceae bacterium]
MLFQKETSESNVYVKAYQPGLITLNIGQFDKPVFLVMGEIQPFNGAQLFVELTLEHLKSNLTESPEILIIGTGETHQFLPHEITQTLNDGGIAVEAMASREACHTYQVLTYEQRRVCALIFP